MITLMYDNNEETYNSPYFALLRVKELEEHGEIVSWSCVDPYDNDYMWENY